MKEENEKEKERMKEREEGQKEGRKEICDVPDAYNYNSMAVKQ